MRGRAFIAVLGFSAPALAAPEPSQKDIEVAIASAKDVRDSVEDDKYLDVAAAFVVEETDIRRDLAYAHGLKKRTALEENNGNVVVVPIPDVVAGAIAARDEYIARVPAAKDKEDNAILYAFDNADVFFVYGQFPEARRRFEKIYGEHGLSDSWGTRSWEKLVSIAAKTQDVDRAEMLAKANPKSDLSVDVLRRVALIRADAHQRSHDYRRAIDDYESFVRDYPGSPDAQAAYEELANLYVATFDFEKAAAAFAAVRKKDAARNALSLYAALGDRDKVRAERWILSTFQLSPGERAEADFIEAKANHDLAGYWARNTNDPAAASYVVEAAWSVAKEKNERVWLERTIAAWARTKSAAQADYAAEAEFTIVDADIRADFDGRPYAKLPADEVMKAYERDGKRAGEYEKRLDHIVQTYASPAFVAAAIARQGSLYESLRSGLDACGGSKFDPVPPKLRQVIEGMKKSGDAKMIDKATTIEESIKDAWRTKRDKEVVANESIMIRRYAQSYALAKKHGVPSVALAPLAHYTVVLGDAKMRSYVPDYTDGMFLQAKPVVTFPPMTGVVPPKP